MSLEQINVIKYNAAKITAVHLHFHVVKKKKKKQSCCSPSLIHATQQWINQHPIHKSASICYAENPLAQTGSLYFHAQ